MEKWSERGSKPPVTNTALTSTVLTITVLTSTAKICSQGHFEGIFNLLIILVSSLYDNASMLKSVVSDQKELV